MSLDNPGQLPIVEVLDIVREAFASHDSLVLQAPPGAGKTTMVPLALLSEPWLGEQTILMLEPRRMAAMASARRMAQMLGEKVGETVGYRIRQDNRVGPNTRIEVITEGILTRRLQSDPALEGVGLVIFDEFHERNLDSDLGLALAMQGRALFREGPALKLMAMSATLDGEAVAELMDDAPLITSKGRQFPVTTSYGRPWKPGDSIVQPTVEAVLIALVERPGNILVFLPGRGEIERVAQELAQWVESTCEELVVIAPLYGGLSLAAQAEAIELPAEGVRKIVLATNLAETSLTIEGIHTVVDSGLARQPVYDPGTGMTRLATRRISRASAEQRQGRAGRLGPGHCYRLWSEEQHWSLEARSTPEILQADLTPLALQLLAWGVDDPAELAWLDSPPAGPYRAGLAVLQQCGAVVESESGQFQLNMHGLQMAAMPTHPRLAHMLLLGRDIDELHTASLLAAVLSERNPLAGQDCDMAYTLGVLEGSTSCPSQHKHWLERTNKQAGRFRTLASAAGSVPSRGKRVDKVDIPGVLLASAYPDRVARFASPGYLLANGRRAQLAENASLNGCKWLAVADVGGRVGQSSDRIYSAAALNPMHFQGILAPLVNDSDYVQWSESEGRFRAEHRRLLGQIVLSKTPMEEVPADIRTQALLDVVRAKGLAVLAWPEKVIHWRNRIALLRNQEMEKGGSSRWPDLSDDYLLATLEEWLTPYLQSVSRIQDFSELDMWSILQAQLAWPLPLELERLAPDKLVVPSGSSVKLDYSRTPPVLEVKLQEMFGCEDTPSIADGKIHLQVHLLSPAGRPLQITQDLAGFWRTSYQEVKREMKGRYPKHPWPDDPLGAEATRHTKRRSEPA